MRMQLGPPRWPFTMEKWYVDALLPDGTVLLVYVGRMYLCGLSWPRVTAELFRADGSVVRGAAVAKPSEGLGEALDVGAACIDADSIRFETTGLSGELKMRPRFAPVTLLDPVWATKSRRLTWVMEVPDADVEGHVRWPGGALAIEGRGYRDRVRMEISPWRFPIRRLVWGHAAAGPHAAVWLQLDTETGPIQARWRDGRIGSDREGLHDGVTLDDDTPFLDADILDLDGLALGPLRGPLKRLGGDPHETKLRAAATIDGHPGRAVHEVVVWR